MVGSGNSTFPSILKGKIIFLKVKSNYSRWQEPIAQLEGAQCCNHNVADSSRIPFGGKKKVLIADQSEETGK